LGKLFSAFHSRRHELILLVFTKCDSLVSCVYHYYIKKTIPTTQNGPTVPTPTPEPRPQNPSLKIISIALWESNMHASVSSHHEPHPCAGRNPSNIPFRHEPSKRAPLGLHLARLPEELEEIPHVPTGCCIFDFRQAGAQIPWGFCERSGNFTSPFVAG
jgi:hypothetical protein